MNTFIDSLLNRVTMYRLTLYYLAALLLVAFGLGLFKLAPNDPGALAFSFALIAAVCWATNRFFAWLLHVPANRESVLYNGAHSHADHAAGRGHGQVWAWPGWFWRPSSPSPRNSC